MNTPLLVLSQYVYAKRQNGGFYSGRIEGRESDNSYNISFSDYTRSTVSEDDLVWLGFYSLPPESWPKSPTIHPVKPGETVKREVDSFSSRRPDSLKFLKDATKEWVLSEERKLSSAQVFSREHYPCTTKCESMPARSTDRTHSTQRTSVLRLNRKALSKEISQDHTEDSSPPPPMQDTRVSGEMMTPYNDRNESSNHHFQNPSQCPGSPRPSYDRYEPPYFNTPCLTPPSTPVPTSLPPPLFACNPYDPAVFGDMWPHVDSRDIGGGKRRRRDSMKKCRKVYGIDNRSLWCTQCKWKKACTRFQMANFGQRVY